MFSKHTHMKKIFLEQGDIYHIQVVLQETYFLDFELYWSRIMSCVTKKNNLFFASSLESLQLQNFSVH
jgi:hypothetical protein